jgi:AmmeMemoRadiSam system radical SAM enzyme/AmmeMemoRadiSam system protein B/AmmeMemoRadiSam system protein A
MPRKVILPPDEPPDIDGTKAGGWWHESDGGRLSCDLCPRACSLGPDDRGFCFVRQNRGGRIVSTTYGRSTGFCIDPIEKKPLNQFYPGTAVLSFGTAGCNLGCKFCQNWTSSKSREVDRFCDAAQPEAVARAAREIGCRSVAFTYNDPIVWAEYAIDTAKACRALDIKTVAVTSGYIMPAARETFFEGMDAANIDLKGFSEEFYRRLTVGHLEPVLDTLRWLVHQSDVWVEITNLIIPGENDSPDELRAMCRWIVEELGPDVPLHFSAFHPDFRMLDHEPTPIKTLLTAHDIARRAGLRYVYTGNVSDRRRQTTYCPDCGGMLIERDGYHLGEYALEQDHCGHCGKHIAGRFDAAPGNWGTKRQPIRIADFAVAQPSPVAQPPSAVELQSPPAVAQPPSAVELQSAVETRRDGCEAASGFPTRLPKPTGGTPMENEPTNTPPTDSPGTVRPELTEQQEALIFRAATERVVAAVARHPAAAMDPPLPSEVAERPLLGAFVSLKRGGQLRSCCGFLGQSVPLAQAVDHAADRAAKDDPRFPPISSTELEHLDMEVWLLWGLRPVSARGKNRIGAVEIGRHGLQIARGGARGLLLPGVAVEHNLDAEAFLRQVCLKAQLPPDAWKEDSTTLMTFEGHAIHGPLAPATGSPDQDIPPGGPSRTELEDLVDFCRRNLAAMVCGATPSCYLSGGFDGGVSGLALTVRPSESDDTIEVSRLAMRPDVPLQATLFSFLQAAADRLRARGVDPVASLDVGLSVLWDPALHGTFDQPDLAGVDPQHRAVAVVQQSAWAWVHDPALDAESLLAEAAKLAHLRQDSTANVLSLAIVSTEPRPSAGNVPPPESARPAAVAGQFYPGEPGQLARAVDKMLAEMLPEQRNPQPWAGAIVPHAGWVYSGSLAAEVFSRIAFPPLVIILCPKHRADGADWAVAPNHGWSWPGGQLASDPELAARLAEAVTDLELDATAHRLEHAIEVQLPLLARLAPQSRVVGVTMHGGDWPRLERFAEQLAGVIRDMPERPLLVVSTDMNHYADDAETRRVDRLALDAIESLNPKHVLDTVRDNDITMCGVVPAVVAMETLRRLDSLKRCEPVGYATSAEVSGDKNRVVGYAGMLFN